jgi:hypothetical protein
VSTTASTRSPFMACTVVLVGTGRRGECAPGRRSAHASVRYAYRSNSGGVPRSHPGHGYAREMHTQRMGCRWTAPEPGAAAAGGDGLATGLSRDLGRS